MKPRRTMTAPLSSRKERTRRTVASVRHSSAKPKVEINITINRPPEELFAFWRRFENLPRVMEHVESVQQLDERRSRWRVWRSKDKHVEWEAEIINERPNELIEWRTLENSDVHHAGSIWFAHAPGDMGTEVKLTVEYQASGFAEALTRLARRSPEQQMREDLRHFKQLMEAGEVPTTAGQPAYRKKNMVARYEEAK